jgi:type II secretory pathway component PulJ
MQLPQTQKSHALSILCLANLQAKLRRTIFQLDRDCPLVQLRRNQFRHCAMASIIQLLFRTDECDDMCSSFLILQGLMADARRFLSCCIAIQSARCTLAVAG